MVRARRHVTCNRASSRRLRSQPEERNHNQKSATRRAKESRKQIVCSSSTWEWVRQHASLQLDATIHMAGCGWWAYMVIGERSIIPRCQV